LKIGSCAAGVHPMRRWYPDIVSSETVCSVV
jgi:hypothetical protein